MEVKNKTKIKENDIKRQVKEYLDVKGWFNFPLIAGLGSYPGLPDRIAIKGGRVLFLEIKRPGGKQSKYQKQFQANIEKAGGEYILVDSIESIMKVVD